MMPNMFTNRPDDETSELAKNLNNMFDSFERKANEFSKNLHEYRIGRQQMGKLVQQRLEIWSENLKSDAEKFAAFWRNAQEIGLKRAYEILIYQLQKP
jgi:hypothetical protein